jgi:uncharacterized protein (TIGR02145 family)
MASYWVATNGNNYINDGSQGSPWLTVAYACTVVPAGINTINIGVGTFNEGATQMILKTGVSLIGAGKSLTTIISHFQVAALSMNKDNASLQVRSSNVNTANGNQIISDFTLDGDWAAGYGTTGSIGMLVRCRSYVIVRNIIIRDFFFNGVTFAGNNDAGTTDTVNYAIGNQFYDNSVINCGDEADTWSSGYGACFGHQSGMLIHDNIFDNTDVYRFDYTHTYGHSSNNVSLQYSENIKFYKNKSYKPDFAGYYDPNTPDYGGNGGNPVWNFHMECSCCDGGQEVYDNEFYNGDCAIDVAGYYSNKGNYAYSWYIHDNLFTGSPYETDVQGKVAIDIEGHSQNDVWIFRNHMLNLPRFVNITNGSVQWGSSTASNIYIGYNILENCGYGNQGRYIYLNTFRASGGDAINNLNFFNNVIQGTTGDPAIGIVQMFGGSINGFNIKNNIFVNCVQAEGAIYTESGNISNFSLDYNILNGNAHGNVPSISPEPSGYSWPAHNSTSDPGFVSSSDFHLTSDKSGVAITLPDACLYFDKDKNPVPDPPTIGAYEYGASGGGATAPTVTTTAITSITSTTASSGGNVTSDGGASVTARGVCWSTLANPTIALSTKTPNGTGTGSYPISLTGLIANTTYHVRSYATNSVDTAYGNEVTFTTLGGNIPVTAIYIDPQGGVEVFTTYHGTLQFYVTGILPSNATDQTVIWSVNSGGGTINSSGLYTASTNGIADIWATAHDGFGARASYAIPVSGQITLAKDLSDSISLVDANTRVTSFHLTLSIVENALIISDNQTSQVVYQRTINDIGVLTDALGKYLSTNRVDSVTVTDISNNLLVIGSQVLADALSLSDSITVREIGKVLSDSLVLSDTLFTGPEEVSVLTDVITLSDSISAKDIEKVLSDSVVLVDNSNKLISIETADGVTVYENILIGKETLLALVDSLTLSDSTPFLVISQLPVVPPKHKCFLLEILKRGIATLHFTNVPSVANRNLGSGVSFPRAVIVDPRTNDQIYKGINTGIESSILDLGEDRKITTIPKFVPITTESTFLIDKDGNQYTTVDIGTQRWVVENLKVLHYADGTPIPNIVDQTLWSVDVVGACCWYNNDIINKSIYGALYNFYTTQNVHGLVYFEKNGILDPDYRVGTRDDYIKLRTFVGGELVAGDMLKEAGLVHWNPPNYRTENKYGFTGVGAGGRGKNGIFIGLKEANSIWTSDPVGISAYFFALNAGTDAAFINGIEKKYGYSVRCVKDIS